MKNNKNRVAINTHINVVRFCNHFENYYDALNSFIYSYF